MFENVLKPKTGKSYSEAGPFKDQPTYDSAKKMFQGGTNYGTGVKAKVGRLRSGSPGTSPIPQKSLRKAPGSVA